MRSDCDPITWLVDGRNTRAPRLYEESGFVAAARFVSARLRRRTPLVDPAIDALARDASARRGITRRVVADEEILARRTAALANEGARVIEEGFASRAGDVDVIYCYGFGFPRYRGGPMFYADTVGLPAILTRIHEYRERVGPHWKPAPLIEKLVAERRGFYTSG